MSEIRPEDLSTHTGPLPQEYWMVKPIKGEQDRIVVSRSSTKGFHDWEVFKLVPWKTETV